MRKKKKVHKIRKWETTGGKIIITEFSELGPEIPIKDAIKRKLIRVSDEEMQRLFSETELKDMGYDNTKEDNTDD